jgi:Copper transport outer membrane protein, MctB
MFDLRYHVASLAAVFIALVIGILVGVGISGRGALKDVERTNLQNDIRELRAENDDLRRRTQELQAASEYEQETEEAVLANRLRNRRLLLVFIGSVNGAILTSVEKMVDDADGSMARMRALRVPVDFVEVQDALVEIVDAPTRPEDLGRSLAAELLNGGDTPLLNELATTLIEEQEYSVRGAVDGVVIAHNSERQGGPTARFLAGLYNGLVSGGRPAVAVETSRTDDSALPVFDRHGYSTVDNVESPRGRVSLAVLLTGAETGDFGVNGANGPLPDVEPVAPTE